MQPIFQRPYDPERGGVTEAAVERGETVLICDIERWKGAGALRARLSRQLDPQAAQTAWEWYRTSSFISCPVRTTQGRTLGVLALSASPPLAPLSEEHLRVTEVFANLAALALERSELLQREASRARTEELLHAAAQRMTSSLDLDTVYDAIVEQAALITGAPIAVLVRLEVATQTLRAVASVGGTERLSNRRFAVGEGVVGRVADTGIAYVSRPQDARALPAVGRRRGRALVRPRADQPRRTALRRAVGRQPEEGAWASASSACSSRSAARPPPRSSTRSTSSTSGASPARSRAASSPTRRRSSTAISLGLVYEPAGHEVSGGDIFGVWRLPGGALAVLVGDVSGKGLEVAALSAMVRFFVEARTWDSERPATVLEQANAILRSRLAGRVVLVTAFLAIIDGGVLRYANAGHVPPLVVGAGDDPPHELRDDRAPARHPGRRLVRGARARVRARTPAVRHHRRPHRGASRRRAVRPGPGVRARRPSTPRG